MITACRYVLDLSDSLAPPFVFVPAAPRFVRFGGPTGEGLSKDDTTPYLRKVPRPTRLHPKTDQQHILQVSVLS